ncbi:MAG: hypothetical protein IKA02_04380 [Clostridia bacterium]|nr:hypothetical protein [Clostridia bacterium]
MSDKKYVNSDYRVIISHDEVEYGYKTDYTDIDFHFLKEEIEGKEEFVLAFGVVMKAAIRMVGPTFVDKYNKETCICDKYLRMGLQQGLDIVKTKEMLVKACEFVENNELNREKKGKILELAYKYEKEVRECMKKVKEAILTDTDIKGWYQYIPCN